MNENIDIDTLEEEFKVDVCHKQPIGPEISKFFDQTVAFLCTI